MLGPLSGEVVLDLFAGSGAMGLEALSRGAGEAILVERDRAAAAVIRSNVTSLGLERRARVLRRDWRAALADLAREGLVADLVVVDPPYAEWEPVAAGLARPLRGVLALEGRLVAEHPAAGAPSVPGMRADRLRTYGDTGVSLLRWEPG